MGVRVSNDPGGGSLSTYEKKERQGRESNVFTQQELKCAGMELHNRISTFASLLWNVNLVLANRTQCRQNANECNYGRDTRADRFDWRVNTLGVECGIYIIYIFETVNGPTYCNVYVILNTP